VPRVRSPIKGDLYRGSLLNFWCVRPADQGGKWRDSLDGNYEKKTTKFSLLLLKVPKDFDEITQGLQDSEAFFLSLL